ncbi:MAG: hypothetical protein K1X61_09760 [Chitinophagales bacterium]|nr:hypothetical protein [Chitinophagales bacterium]
MNSHLFFSGKEGHGDAQNGSAVVVAGTIHSASFMPDVMQQEVAVKLDLPAAGTVAWKLAQHISCQRFRRQLQE